MKLSERIKEGERIAALVDSRAAAVRCLVDIDVWDAVDVDELRFEKGQAGYDLARAAVVQRIEGLNDELRALGIEIDLAATETGFDADEGEDAADEEPEGDE